MAYFWGKGYKPPKRWLLFERSETLLQRSVKPSKARSPRRRKLGQSGYFGFLLNPKRVNWHLTPSTDWANCILFFLARSCATETKRLCMGRKDLTCLVCSRLVCLLTFTKIWDSNHFQGRLSLPRGLLVRGPNAPECQGLWGVHYFGLRWYKWYKPAVWNDTEAIVTSIVQIEDWYFEERLQWPWSPKNMVSFF